MDSQQIEQHAHIICESNHYVCGAGGFSSLSLPLPSAVATCGVSKELVPPIEPIAPEGIYH